MKQMPRIEDIVIRGDMNGIVGNDRTNYDRMHGRYGFGERVLDLASVYEMTIVNTFSKKREEYYITRVK